MAAVVESDSPPPTRLPVKLELVMVAITPNSRSMAPPALVTTADGGDGLVGAERAVGDLDRGAI